MSGQCSGKVVVVTGASRGIGNAAARILAEQGATVLGLSRSAKEKGNLSDLAPGKVTPYRLDVTEEAGVAELFRLLATAPGKVDILVNAAGIGVFGPATSISAEKFSAVLQTNVLGTFLPSREAFRLMAMKGGGRIINLGSIADYVPLVGNAAYGASKFAVRGLTQILNEEGKAASIRVTLLSLGAVDTPIWDGRAGFDRADMLSCDHVAGLILNVACLPLHVRVDEMKVLPPKGVL